MKVSVPVPLLPPQHQHLLPRRGLGPGEWGAALLHHGLHRGRGKRDPAPALQQHQQRVRKNIINRGSRGTEVVSVYQCRVRHPAPLQGILLPERIWNLELYRFAWLLSRRSVAVQFFSWYYKLNKHEYVLHKHSSKESRLSSERKLFTFKCSRWMNQVHYFNVSPVQ